MDRIASYWIELNIKAEISLSHYGDRLIHSSRGCSCLSLTGDDLLDEILFFVNGLDCVVGVESCKG